MELNKALCRAIFAHEDLLEKWRQEQFDVLLTDPVTICGELIAQKLNLPLIISVRPLYVMERLCGQLPAPPSYVPVSGVGYTDQMDFLQRVNNVLFTFLVDMMCSLLVTVKLDPFFTEIMGKSFLFRKKEC